MSDELMTNWELTEALKYLRRKVDSMTERVTVLEHHLHETPELLEPTSTPRYWVKETMSQTHPRVSPK